MKRDEELELVEDEEELDDEDLDDEDLDEFEDYPTTLGVRGFLAGVLVGAVVGAGAALLLAPDRGAVVRKRIGRTWRDLQDDARDQLDDWRGEARREVKKQRRRLRRRLNKVRRD
jgi:hypothetical protein